ncbi:hypothetical protein DS2_12759 [Catenovulum agarivorans DS-2]|uniref:Lipoprotein n=1 Tax=Catenovulum agarivorans DS-2 TaxID=1328313 RepID=W7QBN7_9ALTE|nr:DUF3833 domain-containing protein [Catenovulum agarivorans]EWH09406.1 hypothetical protein DS2_12759 [Catenovulum agarivorans DS-2]
MSFTRVNLVKGAVALLFALVSVSCSSPNIQDYANSQPLLKLEQFFDGELKAYGVLFDRQGQLSRRFKVDLQASWQGNKGTINEWFEFDDGEKQTRIWQLEKLADNQYVGTAGDVVGKAFGTTSGSVLHWRYVLEIPYDGDTMQVNLDDWMYLVDERRLFNKTDIIKFGFKVGEIVLFIEKV